MKIVTTVFAPMIRSTKVYILVVPYCLAITPPLFATYFQEKEGGGVTMRTCAFASQLSPLPRIHVLCSAVEDENSDMPW